MPPKGRKAAKATATKLSETTTRSTRRKRVAEVPPDEAPITQKKTRGARKATAQETVDEPANDMQAEAPRRRGRSAKTAHGPTEAPSAPKRRRATGKRNQDEKVEPVIEELEEITVPKSRRGRAAKATKAESKVVDTAGTQAAETKKRNRAAANQLKNELKDAVAESSIDATRRRGRTAKVDVAKPVEPIAEDKPKRKRPLTTKKTTAGGPEPAESLAPKTSRGRKRQEVTSDSKPEPESSKSATVGRTKRDNASKTSEYTKKEAPKGRATRTTKMSESKGVVPKTGRGGASKKEVLTAGESAATARKGRGRLKKEQPTEAMDTTVEGELAESAVEIRRGPKRVSIAAGEHPEASTPAKKTPAPSKRISYVSTPVEPSTLGHSSTMKSTGRGKRAAVEDSTELPSSPAPKRAKRSSTTIGAEEESTSIDHTTPSSIQSRRRTIAGPATPRTSAASPRAPQTVPANNKKTGRPSKAASSVSKQTSRRGPVSQKAGKDSSEGEHNEGTTSRRISSASTHPKDTIQADTKVTPSTPVHKKATPKPPKTAPPKKAAKAAGAKRKRASSPGPVPKRRNMGSPDVEISTSERLSLSITTPRVTKALQAVIDTRPKTGPAYWLMKAEPDSRLVNGIDVKFSIDDLATVTEPEPWSGVRNHSAKNNMIAMREGDLAFFYHSNCKVPGIVGICEIVGEAVPDETAFEKGHPYYDEKSSKDSPTWYNVHVAFRQKFANREKVTNSELKTYKELENMQYIKQGRLSVSRVEPKEWDFIMQLAGETLRDNSVEKDWVIVSQEDAQPGAEEEEMIVDEAVNAVANIVEEFAEVVGERVGEAVAEEAGAETAAEIADEVAHDVAEAVTEEVVAAIGEGAAVAETAQRGGSGNITAFPELVVPPSEDLSFLPDAPPAEDEIAEPDDLPTALTQADRTKPASRRASADLTPATNEKLSRNRAGSRAHTLGPNEFIAEPTSDIIVEETLTSVEEATIPEAGVDPLSDDLFDDINGDPTDVGAIAAGAVNDLKEAEEHDHTNHNITGMIADAASRATDAVSEGLVMTFDGNIERLETERSGG